MNRVDEFIAMLGSGAFIVEADTVEAVIAEIERLRAELAEKDAQILSWRAATRDKQARMQVEINELTEKLARKGEFHKAALQLATNRMDEIVSGEARIAELERQNGILAIELKAKALRVTELEKARQIQINGVRNI